MFFINKGLDLKHCESTNTKQRTHHIKLMCSRFISTFKHQLPHTMKYILVTGGVISGVGKGVIASSFGTLLNCCGIDVTSIKIDPYINIDAGTFSPYEHGML